MERVGATVYGTVNEVDELDGRHEEKMKRERDEHEEDYELFKELDIGKNLLAAMRMPYLMVCSLSCQ